MANSKCCCAALRCCCTTAVLYAVPGIYNAALHQHSSTSAGGTASSNQRKHAQPIYIMRPACSCQLLSLTTHLEDAEYIRATQKVGVHSHARVDEHAQRGADVGFDVRVQIVVTAALQSCRSAGQYPSGCMRSASSQHSSTAAHARCTAAQQLAVAIEA